MIKWAWQAPGSNTASRMAHRPSKAHQQHNLLALMRRVWCFIPGSQHETTQEIVDRCHQLTASLL